MNAAGLKMIGETSEADIVGRHYLRVVSKQDLERVTGLLELALRGEASEFDFQSSSGRYFRSNFVPLPDVGPGPARLLSITQDVTDRRRLIRELDHRVKNTLATVHALSQQTRRTSAGLDDYSEVFDARLHALARSHETLARAHWQGVGAHQIIGLATQVAGGAAGKIAVTGDDVVLPARSCGPFTLALHEMTTNALKHGALTDEGGTVRIVTACCEGELQVDWRECHPAATPQRLSPGVGLRLVRGFVEHDLRGRLTLEAGTEGVHATITIPLHV